jgi:hypothetical protein
MAGSLHGLNSYRFPIGVVRLHIIKAVDVKCVSLCLWRTERLNFTSGMLRAHLVAR